MEGVSGGRLESICEVIIDVNDVTARAAIADGERSPYRPPRAGPPRGASPPGDRPVRRPQSLARRSRARAIRRPASPAARPQPWLPPFVAPLTFPSAGHDIIRFFRTSSVREPRRPIAHVDHIRTTSIPINYGAFTTHLHISRHLDRRAASRRASMRDRRRPALCRQRRDSAGRPVRLACGEDQPSRGGG
jgi:hypothetical protein